MIKFSLADLFTKKPIKINDDGNLTAVDEITNVAIGITQAHHEIHEGKSYCVEEGIVLNSGTTITKEYLIEVPDSKELPHMVIGVSGAQDTLVTFERGTTYTRNFVNVFESHNRNQNSDNKSGVVISHTPGGVKGSVTEIFSARWGIATAAGGRGGTGGGIGERPEMILKRNTKYVLTITALSTNDNNITTAICWYDQEPKDE